MNSKVRSSLFAVATGPFFFFISGEAVYEFTKKDSFLLPVIACTAALVGVLVSFWWFQRISRGSLFTVSSRYMEASKRFGFVLGILVGSPVFTSVCYHSMDLRWASIIPYIFFTPGMLIVGFIVTASLVHAAFWCLDGLSIQGEQ